MASTHRSRTHGQPPPLLRLALQPAAAVALLGLPVLVWSAGIHFVVGSYEAGACTLAVAGVWLESLALSRRRLQRRLGVPLGHLAGALDRLDLRASHRPLDKQATAETMRLARAVDRLCERARDVAVRADAVLAASRDGVLTIDHTGIVQSASPAALQMFGWSGDLIGQPIARLMTGGQADRFAAQLAHYLLTGSRRAVGATHEHIALRADGSTLPVTVYVQRVDRGAAPPLFTGIVRARSEPARSEPGSLRQSTSIEQVDLQLAQARFEADDARARAEAANRSKSEFLANMSREIRTPMTAILGFAESLRDPGQSEAERLQAIETILRNGNHLMVLINDILDLSKIEAGQLALERLPFSPIDLVADVAALMRARCAPKHLRFDVRCEGPLPATIRSDAARVRQVLINLCGYAIECTGSGSVTLTLRLRADTVERGARVEFEVRDTGIGIAPEQIEHLFEPFAQADASTTRCAGGTGPGLGVSRRLVELLGGTIAVASEPGAGSVFTFTVDPGPLDGVPLVQGATEATAGGQQREPSPTPRRLRGRILLAEDGPDNRLLITQLLEKAGAQVTVVGDGRSAVAQAVAAEAGGEPFDLVLMDMQMPVMDGYQATSELRRNGFRKPIVALTANALHGDQERCLGAGCTAFTPKPVERRALFDTLAQLLPARPTEA